MLSTSSFAHQGYWGIRYTSYRLHNSRYRLGFLMLNTSFFEKVSYLPFTEQNSTLFAVAVRPCVEERDIEIKDLEVKLVNGDILTLQSSPQYAQPQNVALD